MYSREGYPVRVLCPSCHGLGYRHVPGGTYLCTQCHGQRLVHLDELPDDNDDWQGDA